MLLKIDSWEFDLDLTATMEYSATELAEHCDCSYCRNFYQGVDRVYPQLRSLLARFGVDIEAPDELLPYDVDDQMYYDGVYTVSGRILQEDANPIRCGDVTIFPETDNGLHINTGCPEPRFYLVVGTMILPWTLNEPMEDAVSPANAPSFLQKMMDWLLKKPPTDHTTS